MKTLYWLCPAWLYHVEDVHIGRRVIRLGLVLGIPISRRVIRECPVSMR